MWLSEADRTPSTILNLIEQIHESACFHPPFKTGLKELVRGFGGSGSVWTSPHRRESGCAKTRSGSGVTARGLRGFLVSGSLFCAQQVCRVAGGAEYPPALPMVGRMGRAPLALAEQFVEA